MLEGMRLKKGQKSSSNFLQMSIIAKGLLGRNMPFFPQHRMLICTHDFGAVMTKQDQLMGTRFIFFKAGNNLPERMLLCFSSEL